VRAGALMLSTALVALAGTASAQAPTAPPANDAFVLEEIIVTARKRDETLQSVPFSINALSGNQMRERGAENIEDVARNIAGLTIQNLGPGQSQVAIRGISSGQIVRDQPGVKEQVGVYLDESVISLSLFTPDIDLYDLERVEVLRGPQGTLYGSGSMSGTIRYITAKPSVDGVEGSGEVGIETIESGGTGYSVKGMVNVPASDKVALRVVGYHTDYAGFIDAVQPDGSIDKDVNDGTRTGARASVLLRPTEMISITPRIIYQEIKTDGFNREDEFNILANELTPTTDARRLYIFDDLQQFRQLEERFEDEFLLTDLTVQWDLENISLTSITSYTERDILVRRDASQLTGSITGQPGGLARGPNVYRISTPLADTTDVTVFTQEGRIASAGSGRFQWVAGAFYSEIEREYGQRLDVPGFTALTGVTTAGPLAPTDVLYFSAIPYDFKQLAVFGEGSYDLTDALTVTAGLRWFDFEEDRVLNFDGIFASRTIGVPGNTSSDGLSPRVILAYDVNEDVQLNAQVAKGFRLGGINDPLNLPLCSTQDRTTFGGRENFDDETVWNYEGGAKVTFGGGRGRLNVAGFYSDISNLQVTLDAGTCSSRIIFNADARSMGAEAEFSYQLTDTFSVNLGGSIVDSEFTETVTSTSGTTTRVVGGIEDGNRLPTVPKFQFSASGSYEREITPDLLGFLVATYQHVGSRFTQAVDQDATSVGTFTRIGIGTQPATAYSFDPKLPAYDLVNLRLGIRADSWEAAAYVNNLFDEKAYLSLDRERGFRARVARQVNKPRTFGLNLTTRF
jgi:iron complex outermembrane receptor protein